MQKLVFIVDDNDANLTVAASALEGEYRVLTMPSAQKMFSLLEKKKPDLILLDVEMPEISGLEATARLKENQQWKDIPILFLTGYCDEKLLSDAKSSGALEVIHKPFAPSELLEKVNKYVSIQPR
ncbi:MAG: response regulator [Treponema sp.]|nr:response regulator [Treponema sp.]